MVQVFGVIREAERGCQMKGHRLNGDIGGERNSNILCMCIAIVFVYARSSH